MEKHTFYTNDQRYLFVQKFKKSNQSMSDFCRDHNLKRGTFKSWVNALDSVSGSFLDVTKLPEEPLQIIKEEDMTVNVLKQEEIIKKSKHYSRFDHSIIVIEYKGIKTTTSLNQALKILELFYDRH